MAEQHPGANVQILDFQREKNCRRF